MNIAIVGQQKYELQDRICVLLGLQLVNQADTSLEIEPAGAEDARIVLEVSTRRRVIDVQVKGQESSAIGISEMVDWLCHFPAYKKAQPLLEQLCNDEQREVLVVASARCLDAAAGYLSKLDVQALSPANVRRVDADHFLTFMGLWIAQQPDTKFNEVRKPYLEALAKRLRTAQLHSGLKRVHVAERVFLEDVIERSKQLLGRDHTIAPDAMDGVLDALRDIVVREKKTGRNALAPMRECLLAARPVDSLRGAHYVARGEEAAWFKKLSSERAVLLAGRPRTGKTRAAEWLTAGLRDAGYSWRRFTDTAEVERYLLDPVDEPRAALVDDPLGAAHKSSNAAEQLQRLEQLLPRLRSNRRLIVAQAQDRLLETVRVASLHDVSTAGFRWCEVQEPNGHVLQAVWRHACADFQVPEALCEQVSREIETGAIVLEPGCLIHLAANHRDLGTAATTDNIIRVARQDAKSLARAFRQEGLHALARALAISTANDEPVATLDLAFVLGSGGPVRPTYSDVIGTMFHHGSESKKPKYVEAAYEPTPALDQQTTESLESLELRRVLRIVSGDRLNFAHPFYRASGEALVDGATAAALSGVLHAASRALFAVSIETARAAAKNLGWIYDSRPAAQRGQLVRLAEDGLQSIYPAVRDLAFEFLIARVSQFDPETQSRVSTWVKLITSLSVTSLLWTNGPARVPMVSGSNILESNFVVERKVLNEHAGQAVIDLNDLASTEITALSFAAAVQHYGENPAELTSRAVQRLLSSDVGILRAKTAQAWLSEPRHQDEEILERLFADSHPAVAEKSMRGVLRAWPRLDPSRRLRLLNGLRQMATLPGPAAALVESLVLFGRAEIDSDPPWEMFVDLLPVVLRQLPPAAEFRDDRLYHVLSTAAKRLPEDQKLPIVREWHALIMRSWRFRAPSDYQLGVVGELIHATLQKPELRGDSFSQLLSLNDTGTRARVLVDLVADWDVLRDDEQLAVTAVLSDPENRDLRWLRAAVLAQEIVPEPVAAACVAAPAATLDLDPSALIAFLSPVLLDAIVNFYTVAAPIVQSAHLSLGPESRWTPLVLELAVRPTHPLFATAFTYLLWREKTEDLQRVIRLLGEPVAPQIFELMIAQKEANNGGFMLAVWDALFAVVPDEQTRSGWIARMAALAPRVLQDFGETRMWVPAKYVGEFMTHYQTEVQLVQMLHGLGQDVDAEVLNALEQLLEAAVKNAPPRHPSIYSVLSHLLRQMGSNNSALLSILEKGRRDLVTKIYAEPTRRHEVDPPDWLRWRDAVALVN